MREIVRQNKAEMLGWRHADGCGEMLIDVEEPAPNLVLNGCLYGIVLVAALSLIPWRLAAGRGRGTLWLPLASLALIAPRVAP